MVVSDEELVGLYNEALALVFPSLYEGFGLPIVEAFACGTPVIASCAASIPEVAGDAAILVDPNDPDAFCAAIKGVHDSVELREDLRRRGRERLTMFTPNECRSRFRALYDALEARTKSIDHGVASPPLEITEPGAAIATTGALVPFEQWIAQIPGWLDREEGLLLYTLARAWPGAGRVVELGAYQGRSTAFLAAGVRDRAGGTAPVISIDTHEGSPEHQPGQGFFDPSVLDPATMKVNTLPLFLRNLERHGLSPWVETWRCTTEEAAARFHGEVRVLFVDAAHELEAVRRDVALWGAHMGTGGVLVFHDVDLAPGPTQVMREAISSGLFMQFCRVHAAVALIKREGSPRLSPSPAGRSEP